MAEASTDYDDDSGNDEERAEQLRRQAMLDALGLELAEMRSEAIDGRYQTGIEVEWLEDEEFYEGIDDVNRHEMGAYRSKPPGELMVGDEDDASEGVNRGSTIFFNMTRTYCDAGAARVSDMLLPTEDRGWAIRPTPLPELIDIAEAKLPEAEVKSIYSQFEDQEEMERQATLAVGKKTRERFPGRMRSQIDSSFDDIEDPEEREFALAKTYTDVAAKIAEEVTEAKRKAEKAEKRIEDWHVESQYNSHMRHMIEDASRLGTGVLKGPIPSRRRQVAFSKEQGSVIVQIEQVPISIRVDPWNCFPDPSCGENIHNGAYHFERDDITAKTLSELIGQPGYFEDQIRMAIEEGPHEAIREWDPEAHGKSSQMGLSRRDRTKLFEIWYGYVSLTQDQLAACGKQAPENMADAMFIPMAVTLVNNRVIRASINHLDTGEFPYDYMVWQRRSDLPYGVGIARQIRTAQRVINAAARNMMDNAGLAGGPMWAFLNGVMHPMDGIYEIRPRKGWAVNWEVLKDDPRMLEYAFQWFNMEMRQQELQAILEIGLKMAEDVTGLPMLLQGQMGNAPDTVGGMQLLHNNASSIMRRVARLFDDLVTEPHIRRYYTYLLQWGEDDEKGDFQIDARGSTALVERDLNAQAILMLGQFVADPKFGIDPKKYMEELLKSQRLDTKKFSYDDEEWQGIVEALAAQAQKGDSSIEVAQIRAQAMAMVQEMKNQNDDANRQLRIAEFALKNALEERGQELEIAFKAITDELERLKISSQDRRTDAQLKARLSEFLTGLKAQLIMREEDRQTPELVTPPTEPAERAPAGEAYQR